ncbi:hypothetical protein GS682_25990 [Nostoc sp. B(2019)]|nr:hypothetical protein [Nostoc sp. B(2019)]
MRSPSISHSFSILKVHICIATYFQTTPLSNLLRAIAITFSDKKAKILTLLFQNPKTGFSLIGVEKFITIL